MLKKKKEKQEVWNKFKRTKSNKRFPLKNALKKVLGITLKEAKSYLGAWIRHSCTHTNICCQPFYEKRDF